MRFPWANIALILLFAVELVTGYLGLTHNNPGVGGGPGRCSPGWGR